MEAQQRPGWLDASTQRSLADLLACPPPVEARLRLAARSLDFQPGDVVFRQGISSAGLYLVISGLFQRKSERLERRITLNPARPGDLVELGAALSNSTHTFTLTAVLPGALVLLPREALDEAFKACPQMRGRLLEEQAREVSRGYGARRLILAAPSRRRPGEPGGQSR